MRMDDYDIGRVLGRGGFATVHAARDRRTGQKVAIKLVDTSSPRTLSAGGAAGNNNTKQRPSHSRNGDNDVCVAPSPTPRRDGGIPSKHPPPPTSSSPAMTVTDMLSREIAVHASVANENHPNIVKLYGSFRHSNKITAMVMEHCRLGDLQSYLKRVRDHKKQDPEKTTPHDHRAAADTFVGEDEAKHVIRQILRGLSFLHSRGIVHRDIKASNVLLTPAAASDARHGGSVTHDSIVGGTTTTTSPTSSTYSSVATPSASSMKSYGSADIAGFSLLECHAKIGDFGLAVQMDDGDDWDEGQHTLCGTPSCLAPEVAMSTVVPARRLMGDGGRGVLDDDASLCRRGHGQPADLWSTGCIFYAMVAGKYPFSSNNRDRNKNLSDTIARVLKGEWSLPNNVVISSGAKGLLTQLLTRDPTKRGSAEDILSGHVFFNGATIRKNNLRPPRPPPSMPKQIHFESNGAHQNTTCASPHFQQSNSNNGAHPSTTCTSSHVPTRSQNANVSDNTTVHKKPPNAIHMNQQNCIPTNDKKKTHFEKLKGPAYSQLGAFDMDGYRNRNYLRAAEKTPHVTNQDKVNAGNHEENMHPNIDNISGVRGKSHGYGSNPYSKDPIANRQQLENSEPNHGIEPIDTLHRLPPFKYEWQESRIISNTNGNKRASVQCRFFSLPNGHGVVVHQESVADRPGVWLHIAGDGLRFYIGRLSIETEPPLDAAKNGHNCSSNESNKNIVQEAFSRAPAKCREANRQFLEPFSSQKLVLKSNVHSSAALAVSTSEGNGKKSLYKPMSQLLMSKHKSHTSLYKKVHNIVTIVKQSTPKITLYLYSPQNNESKQSNKENTGGLIAKVMLMENAPLPDVVTTFIDGICLRYFLSSGNAALKLPDNYGGGSVTIQLGLLTEKMNNYDSSTLGMGNNARMAKQFEHHIILAQSATVECLHTEKTFESMQSRDRGEKVEHFPVVKKMIMAGQSREKWTTSSTSTAAQHKDDLGAPGETNAIDNSSRVTKEDPCPEPSESSSIKESLPVEFSLRDYLIDEDDTGASLGLL
mmetsp:Transcript_29331/g.35728  ORF Transcript_29331/g.35728 Transcript_29331/m.35728 type:complete len:1040 (-) Transcript_29331:231-3350(-)|eukprot:CAMPEP_0172489944 /NCGR_PEP_ID=MMETSP1066-20121228/20238_1 /TAXON_ID=671091 /ORGANISM="Coscinodiscus wailesii, Strain CCMP2513" /LENGTH=1039 /DNA_ID=CAMNT_0013258171 /DNA_START=372 /DNA_END=3494 /DNA_ORIENTATION=-